MHASAMESHCTWMLVQRMDHWRSVSTFDAASMFPSPAAPHCHPSHPPKHNSFFFLEGKNWITKNFFPLRKSAENDCDRTRIMI